MRFIGETSGDGARQGVGSPRARAARQDRFRALAEANEPHIARYLRSLGLSDADCDDAVQEVLLVLASKLDTLEIGSERPFLFATARRIAGNARRGVRRHLRKLDELARADTQEAPSTEALMDQLHLRSRLDDAIDNLPMDVRLVFVLHEVNEMPVAAIAERLGIAEGTVASRLRRARECFDEAIARSSAAATSVRVRAIGPAKVAPERGAAEILSWWVSGGEADALRAVVRLFARSHPNMPVVSIAAPSAVSAKSHLSSRMSRGVPPDTFQVNGGLDLLRWVRHGGPSDRMEPLDFLFASERWGSAFPSDVRELLSHAGRTYAVPLAIHRTNTLFANKRTFEAYGLSLPTTLEELHFVASTLRARGVVPFGIGYKQPWTITMLAFETVMVAIAGGDYYRDFFTGRRSANDPELRATLAELSCILDYCNADAAALDWDNGVDLLPSGGAAMTIMGDWAKGYLNARGWVGGVDFDVAASPGARDVFVFATDAFGFPKHASRPDSTMELLKVFGSREGQDAFSPLKGSIPARSDVDLSAYDSQARQTARDFRGGTRYPSLPSLAPSSFTRVLDVAMAQFARDRNADKVVAVVRAHYDLLGW